ncbi:MAG: hypothetical protein ACR2N5_00255 [Solirubrobacterales bacterium]
MERHAVFCRLEHIVPWEIQGPAWEAGLDWERPPELESQLACAHCGTALETEALVVVRHRGPHRVRDDFCSVEHLAAWARAGGRWQ